MDEKLSQYFSLIIGFLVPGLIGLFAVSYLEPSVRDWFGGAPGSPTTVGGFLFAVVGSAGMGVFISRVRWFLCDHCFGLFPSAPNLQLESRRDSNHEKAYQDLRAQHYMYFLFYANSLIALQLLFVSWFAMAQPRPQWIHVGLRFALLLAASVVLYFSAKDALAKFDLKAARLLGLVIPPKDSAA